MKITLERHWILGEPIGDGGFGQVFEASTDGYERAAAKLVPKEDGARERLFVDLADVKGARNVIPILESGEIAVAGDHAGSLPTGEYFVLIMPRADKSLRQRLQDQIAAAAPSATFYNDIPVPMVALGGAILEFSLSYTASMEPWEGNVGPAFTVVGYSSIGITNQPGSPYEGRSHSLWFCDAAEKDRFQWFELAFMISPLVKEQSRQIPFALDLGMGAAQALSGVIGRYQVAWPFTPLTIGDLDKFISRWSSWLAEAANGALERPRSMPERSATGSWRR